MENFLFFLKTERKSLNIMDQKQTVDTLKALKLLRRLCNLLLHLFSALPDAEKFIKNGQFDHKLNKGEISDLCTVQKVHFVGY